MPLDCCHHSRLTLQAARRVDPTHTLTLRRKYEAEMVRRFKALRRLIVEAVVVNDVLGLASPASLATMQAANVPPRRAFNFPRSDAKVGAFMQWLQRAAEAGILEIQLGTPIHSVARQSWQGVYLQTAYQAGIQAAASNMRSQGATVEQSWVQGAFLRPVHADRAGLIYARAYAELGGITARMSAAISRTLAQGIAEGRGMRQLSKTLAEQVDVGIKRARVITRTEVIRAHAEATLNSYTEAGLEGVTVSAEYTTAGDNKACRKCAKLEGNTYTIQAARGIIPVHPNCRCAWNPVVRNAQGVVLR